MKTVAYYLPQFHAIPENDEMWGKGFTEWDNLRKARPLFKGHNQPRIPLNKNYYNLLDEGVQEWQVSLARKYHIDAFCMYHYWFDGKLLLEKPVENFLSNKKLDIEFCLCWANEAWTKAWVSKSDDVLYQQHYGTEENWKRHFEYLLPFFKDPRYIKEDNKPLFIIYRPELIDCLNEMLDYMNSQAQNNGFDGMVFAYQQLDFDLINDKDDSRFKYDIEYEPTYSEYDLRKRNKRYNNIFNICKKIDKATMKIFNKNLSDLYIRKVRKKSYDEVWRACVNRVPKNTKRIAGIFIDWDNTPRRGQKGTVYLGATPEKFKKYFAQKIAMVKQYYSTDYLFVFSWNEWAEGGYLEPDSKYGYGYLEAVKEVMEKQ